MVVAVAALLVAVGGSAVAAVSAIPQDGRFTACYQTSGDVLNRIVVLAEPNEDCPQTYARVSWSQSGGAGPQGPQGPAGPQGPPGTAGSFDTATLRLTAVKRRVVMRRPGAAVARCPGGGRAVGGGVVGNPFYETEASYPFVVDGVPVGWAIVPAQKPRFTVIPSRRESTSLWTGLPRHRHYFNTEAHLLPLAPRAFSTTVDVYAVCLRLPVAIPERLK
jgi:hypothetical protein